MSNSGVGFSSSDKELRHTQPVTYTHEDRSLFRLGDALLETAISVTCVRVGHARNEFEHDQAFAELESLRSQRECRGGITRAAIVHDSNAQIRACIDNQIQDCLHEQMDAERVCGGQRLDEYLGSPR
jgi:hypothetical protein